MADREARVQSRSPYRPDDIVIDVPELSVGDVERHAEQARRASEEWRRSPAPGRAAALNRAADAVAGAAGELATLIVREVGKPAPEAQGEVARTVAILRYYAQQILDPDGETFPTPDGRSLLMARRRPRGVVALITPWNFPIAIPLWKAAPALAYGNAVLLKPASPATAIATRVAELISPELPEDLFRVAPGGSRVAQELIRHADAVSFTGSVETGNAVRDAATSHGIPVQAEMGGQNASIVFADADPEAAAGQIAGAAMGYAGQKCTATSRVIVVGGRKGVVDALVAAVNGLGVGDPAATGVQVGPVIDERARDAVLEAAAEAKRQGGTVLTGGERGDGDGWVVLPTLIDGLPPESSIAQNEVFGPIASIHEAKDVETAIRIANGVRYGLVTSVYTNDVSRALWALERIDTGLVKVNSPTTGVDFYAPFGGEKESSYGPREQGKAAREFYSSVQTITVSPLG